MPAETPFVPRTANLHIVPTCNYACRFCYDTFTGYSLKDVLSIDQVAQVFRMLADHGVKKLTIAGGEPTLHPRLREVLTLACEADLVPSIVSNGRRIDTRWMEDHAPFLRWLALSCDSVHEAVSDALGRRLRSKPGGHVTHVQEVFRLAHSWSSIRPAARRLRLKLNMVVTALNAMEDPRPFVRDCGPERVKLMQMLPVEGENDAATDLLCSDEVFASYVARASTLAREDGIAVTPEGNAYMSGSYLMIDPLGCLFQLREGRYVKSRPLFEVGLVAALRDIGGVDAERFSLRGGDYAPGEVPRGNLPYVVAIEGLDGAGKSTIACALAERIGAAVVENPPRGWSGERVAADRADEVMRRAFYLRGNRAAMEQANAIRADGRPVVMDRSFASTLAYGEATAGRVAHPAGWPADLEKPDLLVLLHVEESVRQVRLAARGSQTKEERALSADPGFRERVIDGHRALGARDVDASASVATVVSLIEGWVRAGLTS